MNTRIIKAFQQSDASRLRAHTVNVCNLVIVKARHSCLWVFLLGILATGGRFHLSAQTNDSAANASVLVPEVTNTADSSISAAESSTLNGPLTNSVTPAPAAGESISTPSPNRQLSRTLPSGKLDYSSFRLVNDRNIFNGNRSGQRITSTRSSSQQRSVRVEAFTLVGTLLSGNAPVAFFDGTESSYRKALPTGASIAGFRIRDILPGGIRLDEGTNTLDLRVGRSLRREELGLWKHSASAAAFASKNDASGSETQRDQGGETSPPGDPGGASAAPGEMNDVLKRLMERKAKE